MRLVYIVYKYLFIYKCCLPGVSVFLQLPMSMYKKVLVILHDSILPHMSDPKLMIDFLTAAYNVGEFNSMKNWRINTL